MAGDTANRSAGGLESTNAVRDDDVALVAAAQRDRLAFAPLYERYAERLFRYACARTGSASIAEDIVADAMLAAMNRIAQFDPNRGSFASWLFTIATNQIVDQQRRSNRHRQTIERAHQPSPPADDALTTLVRHQDAQRIHEALNNLPESDRDLVLLRYWAELTSAEIGRVIGISPGNVRVRLTRILSKLAQLLEVDQ
ncbi:MAG: RNA polymerase sigma factor [Thermomicrobiales bacterium]|nr:RNA polymerase sigma factor [Thermomicrobiales bacterium]